MKGLTQAALDELVRKTVRKRHIFGAVFCVESEDGFLSLLSAAGNIKPDDRYYIASINKLFVSAIVLKLAAEKRIGLEDRIGRYLAEDSLSGLHVFQGIDYSREITVTHLLSQTSGLPCYLLDKRPGGARAMGELVRGIDQPWPIDRVITEVKRMSPSFSPGSKGKARYIDTNHQLLSRIIENVTGMPVDIALKKLVFEELGMTRTSVCKDVGDTDFVPIYCKGKPVFLPLFLSSTKNDIVSTAKDQMTFLRAFFSGRFFPVQRLKELKKWNRIFFPFHYGIGIQKFSLPRLFSPFKDTPDMLGHCGSTGSVAFHVPGKGLYITGTVNQQERPSLAFQCMIRMVNLAG